MGAWGYWKLGRVEMYAEWREGPAMLRMEREAGELRLWLGKLELVVSQPRQDVRRR